MFVKCFHHCIFEWFHNTMKSCHAYLSHTNAFLFTAHLIFIPIYCPPHAYSYLPPTSCLFLFTAHLIFIPIYRTIHIYSLNFLHFSVVCFDAKINFDDNAKFRQKEIFDREDTSESDPREVEATKYNLSYIGMSGNIGCLGNLGHTHLPLSPSSSVVYMCN